MSSLILTIFSLFFTKAAEIAVVGLQVSTSQGLEYVAYYLFQASGKTSFVNVIGSGQVYHNSPSNA